MICKPLLDHPQRSLLVKLAMDSINAIEQHVFPLLGIELLIIEFDARARSHQ